MQYTLEELVDVNAFQELTEALYRVTGIPTAIVTLEGRIVSGSGWQRICTEFHRKHPEARERCLASDRRIRPNAAEGEVFVTYRCPFGLIDSCAPLIVEGEHLANLFAGQLFLEPPGEKVEAAFREQARAHGFDEREYLAAMHEVPVFTAEKFQAVLGFLAKLAETIVTSALARLRESAEQKRAEEAVRRSEARYRSLFANIIEGFSYCRMVFEGGLPADFVYLETNEAFQRLTGLRDVVGKRVTEVLPGLKEAHPEIFEAYGRVALTGVPERFEVYLEPLEAWLAITAYSVERGYFSAVFQNISERVRAEQERNQTIELLELLNSGGSKDDLLRELVRHLKSWSGCEAVAIRVREAHDYPYVEASGFPEAFLRMESELCPRDEDGGVECDEAGQPALQCMCGKVIRGRFQERDAFFSSQGSFWTNSTSDLMDGTANGEGRATMRNHCHAAGYESVALIPIRNGGETLGLLQFNDRERGRFTPETISLYERLAGNIGAFLTNTLVEEELARSRDRFRALYEYSSVPIWEEDFSLVKARFDALRAQGVEDFRAYFEDHPEEVVRCAGRVKVVDVNQESLRFFGVRRKQDLLTDLASSIISDLAVSPSDGSCPPLLEELITLAEGRTRFICETAIRTPGGEEKLLSVHLSVVPGCEATLSRVMVSFWDISERKRAEEEKDRLRAQLLQAQKMESVGRLAGGVAHDFNNMLSVIIGHADLALEELQPDDPLTEDLLEIRQAGHRSADLTRQLLAFARRQPVSPEILDLNHTVSGMLRMLGRLIGEDIELVWKPAPAIGPVEMDPAQVDQVLANLVVNARDAVEGTGTVTIETADLMLGATEVERYPGMTAGCYVLLAVSDSGAGMDQKTLDHLFEPFFTTKELGKGTGLGLAIVYGIVKQNQGFVYVDSQPGRGTTFKIYLPCAADEAAAEPAGSPGVDLRGDETVLLVEDEGAILRLGKSILRRYGYDVLAAASPAEALLMVEDHEGPIDLLVTDMIMPGMDGSQLLAKVEELRPGIRCLVVSGYTSDGPGTRGNGNGRPDAGIARRRKMEFLQKPFSATALVEKVRAVLDQKEDSAQTARSRGPAALI